MELSVVLVTDQDIFTFSNYCMSDGSIVKESEGTHTSGDYSYSSTDKSILLGIVFICFEKPIFR